MRSVCAFQVGSLAHTKVIREGVTQLLEGKGDSGDCTDPLQGASDTRESQETGVGFQVPTFSVFRGISPKHEGPLRAVRILCEGKGFSSAKESPSLEEEAIVRRRQLLLLSVSLTFRSVAQTVKVSNHLNHFYPI